MHINVLKSKICELIQKVTKYVKLCINNFYIWNIHTMNRIYIESEFQYAFSRQICKCLKFRDLIIIMTQTVNELRRRLKPDKSRWRSWQSSYRPQTLRNTVFKTGTVNQSSVPIDNRMCGDTKEKGCNGWNRDTRVTQPKLMDRTLISEGVQATTVSSSFKVLKFYENIVRMKNQ
jgi:hypothetical protein